MAPTDLIDLYGKFDEYFNSSRYVEGAAEFGRLFPPATASEPYPIAALFAGIFLARFHLIRGDHAQTRHVLDQVDKQLSASHPGHQLALAELLHSWGEFYYYVDDLRRAKSSVEQAIHIKRKLCNPAETTADAAFPGFYHISLGQSLVVLGKVDWKLANHGDVLLHYYEALLCYQEVRGTRHLHLIGRLYGLLGEVHYSNGKTERAVDFLSRSLEHLRRATTNTDHLYLSRTYIDMARAKLKRDPIFDFEAIQQAIVQGEALLCKNNLPSAHRYFASLADTWSLFYYRKAKAGPPEQARPLYDQALKYLDKSFRIRAKALNANHSSLAQICCNRARIYIRLRDYDRAWEQAELALRHLFNQPTFSPLRDPFPALDLQSLSAPRVYVAALGLLAEAYGGQLQLQETPLLVPQESIYRGLQWLEKAQHAIEQWRRAVRFEISLALTLPQIRRVQELHFQWLYALHQHPLVGEAVREKDRRIFTWLCKRNLDWVQEMIETKPPNVRKVDLLAGLQSLEKLEKELINEAPLRDTNKIKQLISDLSVQIKAYNDQSRRAMKSPLDQQEEERKISIDQLWQVLTQSGDRVMITYFISHDAVHAVSFHAGKASRQVRIDRLLSGPVQLEDYYRATRTCDQILSKQFDKQPSPTQLPGWKSELGYLLVTLNRFYEKLIAPLHLPKGVPLCIIPDGWLYQVPFDALVTELPVELIRKGLLFQPEDSILEQLSYLFLFHPISYHYSAAALCRIEQRRVSRTIAPDWRMLSIGTMSDKGVADFHDLILGIAQRFVRASNPHDYFSEKEIDWYEFRFALWGAALIHVFAHNQWTSEARQHLRITLREFDNKKTQLTRQEIRAIELNAHLVILNVCRGNHGQDPFGDGPDGYARAFLEAGADNVVTALFRSTVFITELLTLRLAKKLSKHTYDKAIRKSKRWLLAAFPRYQHPAYWAGFAIMGNGQSHYLLRPPDVDLQKE